ncbi:hypothetical protein Lser_V15G31347 [Lactuca serriola]
MVSEHSPSPGIKAGDKGGGKEARGAQLKKVESLETELGYLYARMENQGHQIQQNAESMASLQLKTDQKFKEILSAIANSRPEEPNGDANGKLMLAHAASAQGISVVEQVSGKDHVMNHLSIPATCFTHPEISMPQAKEKAKKEKFKISVAMTSFKANTKALAENQGEGVANLIYRADTGEILGVHILGMHADDLIHEASYVMALGTRVQDLKYAVHVHPTLSEVLDELFK